MKKFFLFILSLSIMAAQAQSVDEIVDKYTNAAGGLDAYNKITTVKITAVASMQGMDLPVVTQIVNGKSMRTDVEVMGQSVTNVYHNGTGWKINPFGGAETATDVTGEELEDFKWQAFMASNLMDYKARGHKAELLPETDADGVKVFVIALTTKDAGKVTRYYINQADYSLVKSVTKRDMQGQEVDLETYSSDFKEMNGIKMAMTRTVKIEGQDFQSITIDKVEFDVTIDESIFGK